VPDAEIDNFKMKPFGDSGDHQYIDFGLSDNIADPEK
jgi:hypothetical protein